MSSRKKKRAALYEKLQSLREATHSSSVNKASIIVDASKYIQELKGKVERLNQEIGTSGAATSQNPLPVVHINYSNPYLLPPVMVETIEKGFLINVFSDKNCPGLLVSILEAFDELGLDVLDARVSCSDNFQLEAVGGENEGHDDSIDARVVKQAVLQAIKNWSENNEQE